MVKATKAETKAPTVGGRITSKQIIELLRIHRHPPGREWVSFSEVRSHVGFAERESNHSSMDLFAVNCYPSKKFRSVAYEVKVDRADFMRELTDPTKRQHAERLAMECWFATPPGLVRPDEVPEGWGLVVVPPMGTPKTLKMPMQRVPAPWETPFIISLLRKAADPPSEIPLALWQVAGRSLTVEDLRRVFHEETAAIRQQIREEEQEDVRRRIDTEKERLADQIRDAEQLRSALGERLGLTPWAAQHTPVGELIKRVDAPEWDRRVIYQLEELQKGLGNMLAKARAVPPMRTITRDFPRGEDIPLVPLQGEGDVPRT